MADHDLATEMEEAGWKHGWGADGCPNEWRCQFTCPCHQLAPDALEDDLAAHFRIEAWTKEVPSPGRRRPRPDDPMTMPWPHDAPVN